MPDDNIMICKYRPKSLSEVIGQPVIVRRLKKLVSAKKCMHMMFTGPQGVGKTTCAQAFLQDLYGDKWRDNVLELNASDERGIETIRTKVQEYSKLLNMNDDVGFKVIFLDEADYLTRDAQATLRRVMEDYSLTNRFILSCNYAHKIIPPIQDRCSIFRFGKLDWSEIFEGLSRVVKDSKILISDDSIKLISKKSHGSMRRALNILEDLSIGTSKIEDTDVIDVVGTFHRKDIAELLKFAKKQNYQEANMIYLGMKYNGISPVEIIHEMVQYIRESIFPPTIKYRLYYLLGEVEWRISQGADDWIQFVWFLAQIKDIPSEEEIKKQTERINQEMKSSIEPDQELTKKDLGLEKGDSNENTDRSSN